MVLPKPLPRPAFGWRVAVLTLGSAAVNLFIHSTIVVIWIRNQLSLLFADFGTGEVDYLVFIAQALCSGLLLLGLVVSVIAWERPANLRLFFKLGPIDLKGLGLIALCVVILDGLEVSFLRQLVYEPVRLFLTSLGLPGESSLSVTFAPDPHWLGLNLLLLLLIVWIEVPEEVFFRGYVQNHLQDYLNPNLALILGACIWTFWNWVALADFIHILMLGLAFSLVFRLRQNTTPLAIWHPLSNRLLVLLSLISLGLTPVK